MVVAEEAVKELGSALLERWNGGAVGDVDIGPTISVIIEHTDASDRGFDQALGSCRAIIHHHVERRDLPPEIGLRFEELIPRDRPPLWLLPPEESSGRPRRVLA